MSKSIDLIAIIIIFPTGIFAGTILMLKPLFIDRLKKYTININQWSAGRRRLYGFIILMTSIIGLWAKLDKI